MRVLSSEEFETELTDLLRTKLAYLRTVARQIVNSASDADDVLQAAMIKAWQRRGDFRQESNLSGWVARIVVNESYDFLRRKAREKRKLEQFDQPEPDGERRQLQVLDQVVAVLPELYRQTVHIAIFSGLDSSEAARELDCSVNTLYQRIHKAKELIKAGFAGYENE